MEEKKLKKKNNKRRTVFDATSEYESLVAPVIEQLKAVCISHGIPMFVSCCVKNDNRETTYISDGVTPESVRRSVHRDLFPKYLGVINGFDVVPAAFDEPVDVLDDAYVKPDAMKKIISEDEL